MLMPSHVSLLPGDVYYDLPSGIENADVIISLRLQKERMEDGMISSVSEYAKLYQINKKTIHYAKNNCIVMHPGPLNRGIEVDDSSADGPHSVITDQIENGIFVRMAALYWVFGGGFKKKAASSAKAAPAKSKSKPRARKAA